nr:element excision factor XisI family protein [Nostoc sp. EkiNYC01]
MSNVNNKNEKLVATDHLETHKEIVKKVILFYASKISTRRTTKLETNFDETHNCYNLVKTGWEDGREINKILISVVLKGEGVAIKIDTTKGKLANDLIKQGIDKNYIYSSTKSNYLEDWSAFTSITRNALSSVSSALDFSSRAARFRMSGVFFFFLVLMGLTLALVPRVSILFYTYDFSGISAFLAFGGILGLIAWLVLDNLSDRLTYIAEASYQNAADRAAQSPEKAKPAWDMATAKLEVYFNRNLQQIGWIFRLSVVVMLLGFGLVGFGITLAYQKPESITVAIIGGIAGIITQFIGATFLFIYKLTLAQASNYTKSLVKMNSVGMALQVLDGISEEDRLASKGELVNAKIELAKLILANAQEKQISDDKSDEKEKKE